MSVSGQAGYISFAVQAAKVGSGVFDPAAIAWLNHRSLGADIAFQQFVDQIPPELGAGLFTAGSFKAGAYSAGGLALNARMENAIGALLYGAGGKATVGTVQSHLITNPAGTLTVGTPTAGGAVTAGDHSYKVTFVSGSGETAPGTASTVATAITTDGQTIPLTAIPVGGTGTTARKIYRTVTGNTGAYKLLTTIANNSATTFVDTIADAALGASAPSTNTTVSTSGSTIFSPDPTDDTALPWLALRKVIPGDSAGGYQEEFHYDCRVAALSITIPQMGMMTHELAFVGRVPKWIDGKPATGSTVGAFGADFESAASVGQSAEGSISLPGFTSDELPEGGQFTSAQVILANQLSTPQEEMIVGSYNPYDLTPLSRGALVRLVYRWKDASLYRAMHMLAADGVTHIRDWNPMTKSSDVHVISQSQAVVPTFANKYKFDFYSPGCDWVMSPVMLAPRKLLQVELIGTVKQANGVPTWQIEQWNNGAVNAGMVS